MKKVAIIALLGLLALGPSPSAAQTYPGMIGVGVGSPAEGARTRMFVDLGKVFRPFVVVNGSTTAPIDANGWPTTDAEAVFFDVRPTFSWDPPADDPTLFQPDWSGTYHLSFNGQATVRSGGGSFTISNPAYDAASNTTTADLNIPAGDGLLILRFTNTRRTAASGANTVITNIRLIRPGYAANTLQVFSTEFLNSLAHSARCASWTLLSPTTAILPTQTSTM